MLDKIKNALLSKLLSSLLPKYAQKYEGDIRRIALAINTLIAALYTAIPLLPDETEAKVRENLDYLHDQYHYFLDLLYEYTGLDFKGYVQ